MPYERRPGGLIVDSDWIRGRTPSGVSTPLPPPIETIERYSINRLPLLDRSLGTILGMTFLVALLMVVLGFLIVGQPSDARIAECAQTCLSRGLVLEHATVEACECRPVKES